MIGQRLAHYEVLEKIGQGGMGEVYKARDHKLGRDVALKVLPESFAADPERLARFEHEAKLLASLNHPHVATLYDLEHEDGVRFLTMELVEGETLAERIARGSMAGSDATPLFIQIAEGLEAAHAKGVVHRDLKPANVKITSEGAVKILDFGLAKAVATQDSDGHASQSPTMTKDTALGVILGTAPYMSPEQARGKSVDKRTDVWAFGCCLYEALTGRPAFVGETVSDTIAKVLEREPDWDGVPIMLQSILKRCLRKELKKRFHDIADVRIELEETSDESAPLPSPPSRNRTLAAAALLFLGVAVGGVLVSLLRPSAEEVGIIRSAIPFDPATQLALIPGAPSVALSPDGQRIAFVGGPRTARRLYVRSLDAAEARLVEGADGASTPFFSPDGNWVGFVRSPRAIYKVPFSGGAPVEIVALGGNYARGATWGPDGWIVYNRSFNAGLSRVRDDGGEPEVLTTVDRSRREKTHRFPELLPGGKAVLFTLGTLDIDTFDEASIAVLDLDTREYRILIEGGTNPRFSPTGHIVYGRNAELFAAPFDVDALEVNGSSVPFVSRVAMSPIAGNTEFALSRNGSLVYQTGETFDDDSLVVWVDRSGSVEPLSNARRAYLSYLRLSPDGQALAVWIDGANSSVWIHDMARGTLSRLTSSSFLNNSPAWAPDGERVAFRSDRGGARANLYVQERSGTGEAERLTDSPYRQEIGSWSPDGRLVAFHEFRPGTGYDIWTVDVKDRSTHRYRETEFNELWASFSPDGNWIAYQSDATGQEEIYLGPFPESTHQWQVSTEGGVNPRWRRDGKELFYLSGRKMMAVDVQLGGEPVLGRPTVLFETPEGITEWFDVAPDGQRFVMIDQRAEPLPPYLNLIQHWDEELKRLVP